MDNSANQFGISIMSVISPVAFLQDGKELPVPLPKVKKKAIQLNADPDLGSFRRVSQGEVDAALAQSVVDSMA